jgi:hypothetical protein
MGIFNKLTDAIKDAAPVIGGVVGFGLGGPIGAGFGAGIGGLAAGQDVEQALKTGLIGGALGYGASKMGATPFLRGTQTATAVTTPSVSAIQGGVPVDMMNQQIIAQDVAAAQQGGGIMGALGNLSTGQKVALGAAGLGTLGLLGMTPEEEEAGQQRPFPKGEMFDITARSRETGDVYQLTDPEDLAAYQREISDFSYYHGGEVNGPGTGTSDSVPARLSDGEFVLTAKAVRGAGGGDRDIGAARMYDMMAELEAQA